MLKNNLKISLLLNLSLLLVFQKSSLVEARIEANESKLVFYYGPEFSDCQQYELSEAAQIVKNSHFKKGETHLYIHGWTESQTSADINVTVDAYLKRKDINLITVDWAKGAQREYFEAALTNTVLLAPALADAVLDLYQAGVDRKDLRVVGHSLGAQIAGMTGRHIMLKTNGKTKIYRMDLLDAAFPLFTPRFLPTVNESYADFVQAIHTAAGTFGQPISIGHVDFWPNGGRSQPGCPNGIFNLPFGLRTLCSHRRSWRFWAESVANINGTNPKFLALPLSLSNTDTNPVEMGINCSMNARGNYFLKTNNESLFAMGTDGLIKL